MKTRERNVKPSFLNSFEELLLKECVFYLNSVDKLNDILLFEMYNNAVKGGEFIQRQFSQPLPFSNRRGLEDVQRIINRVQKQNDAFNVFFKNQISMNFQNST